ncbi:MAG: CgeB family protein [Coriobacteriia bacterium]
MRLLIIAPTYYGYDFSISTAFRKLDHEVLTCSYYPHTALHHKVINRIAEEALPRVGVAVVSHHRRARFNADVVSRATQFAPNAILVVKGDILYPDTVECLSRTAPCVYWGYDDPYRYPDVVDSLRLYDAVASFSKMDTARMAAEGLNSHYVPLGFDDTVFGLKAAALKRPASVSFIGARYPRRELLLAQLAQRTDLGIWGGDWKRLPWRRRFYERRTLLDRCCRGSAGLAEANAIYASSAVNLNIHGDWDGLNMRVFEIPGASGFQLCDAAPGIEEFFEPDKEIALFSCAEEMVDKALFYARDSMRRQSIAAAGRTRARAQHTLTHRASLLLSVLRTTRTR